MRIQQIREKKIKITINIKKTDLNINQQCIRYQLYEFILTKRIENQKKRAKTIIDCQRHKTK